MIAGWFVRIHDVDAATTCGVDARDRVWVNKKPQTQTKQPNHNGRKCDEPRGRGWAP